MYLTVLIDSVQNPKSIWSLLNLAPTSVTAPIEAAEKLLFWKNGAAARGQSLGSGFAYPVTISQVRAWAAGLQARGIQLAPASALAQR